MLDIKNIVYRYPGSNESDFTLSEMNFKINTGEFVGILGPNGSGKSTLLKLLSGLIHPLEGEVLLDNKPVSKLDRKSVAKKMAFVPQNTSTVFPYSIFEIVAMGRTPYLSRFGFESELDIDKINNAIELLDLKAISGKGINEVSGGEAQRTFIARALAQEPEIILLDEPNSHLDIKHQINIYKLLQQFNREMNITVVAVSHDLNLTAHFCGRGLLMDKGKIVLDDGIVNIVTEKNIKNIFEINSKVSIEDDQNISVVILP